MLSQDLKYILHLKKKFLDFLFVFKVFVQNCKAHSDYINLYLTELEYNANQIQQSDTSN